MTCKGKERYKTYADGLTALFEKVERPELGGCYECPYCGDWHISSRQFTVAKYRGRGKTRRGVVNSKAS